MGGLRLGKHQRGLRLLPRHRALEQERLVARRAKRAQHFLQLAKQDDEKRAEKKEGSSEAAQAGFLKGAKKKLRCKLVDTLGAIANSSVANSDGSFGERTPVPIQPFLFIEGKDLLSHTCSL